MEKFRKKIIVMSRLEQVSTSAILILPSIRYCLLGRKFKFKDIIEKKKSLFLFLPNGDVITVFECSKMTDLWTKSEKTGESSKSEIFCHVAKTISIMALKIIINILENYSEDLPLIEKYNHELLIDVEYDIKSLMKCCDQLQDGIWENVFTLQQNLKRIIAKKRWKLILTFRRICISYQQFLEDYYAPPAENKRGGNGFVLAIYSFKCKSEVLFATHDDSASSVDLNVQNVGIETVIGNSDASTNLITHDVSAPNVDLNVQNVGMETVIGNSDDYTNFVTHDASAPNVDLNVQNVGMETMVILDASASNVDLNVQNVGKETVIRNSDDYKNLVTHDTSAPSVDINVQNVEMETVIGNSDDYTNLVTDDASASNVDLNVLNVGMETVIGNSDASTNLVTFDNCASSIDLNVYNLEMDDETVIGNLDTSINVQNFEMETLTVTGNLDGRVNVPSFGMETTIGNPVVYTNMIGCAAINRYNKKEPL